MLQPELWVGMVFCCCILCTSLSTSQTAPASFKPCFTGEWLWHCSSAFQPPLNNSYGSRKRKAKGQMRQFENSGGLLSLPPFLFRFPWPGLWWGVGWAFGVDSPLWASEILMHFTGLSEPWLAREEWMISRLIHFSAVLTLWEAHPKNTYLFPITSSWLAGVETFPFGQRVLPWWINRSLNMMCVCVSEIYTLRSQIQLFEGVLVCFVLRSEAVCLALI